MADAYSRDLARIDAELRSLVNVRAGHRAEAAKRIGCIVDVTRAINGLVAQRAEIMHARDTAALQVAADALSTAHERIELHELNP